MPQLQSIHTKLKDRFQQEQIKSDLDQECDQFRTILKVKRVSKSTQGVSPQENLENFVSL